MLTRSLVLTSAIVVAQLTNAGSPALSDLGLTAPDRTRLTERPTLVLDFELTDEDGKAFDGRTLIGRTTLVFFGFTNCPNVCPPTMQKIRQVQRQIGVEETKLTAVFVSVDGDRDTPAVLKKYLAPFEPGFIGLTGDAAYVRDLAARFSAVFFKGLPTGASAGYNVEHTSQTYLVDKEGKLRVTFYNAPAEDMVRVARSLL